MMRVEWSDGESRVLGVHRVRMMCSLRTTQFPAGYEASHLCHNKLCLSVHHLSLEPNWVNMQRGRCSQHGCSGHPGYPNCVI